MIQTAEIDTAVTEMTKTTPIQSPTDRFTHTATKIPVLYARQSTLKALVIMHHLIEGLSKSFRTES